MSENGESSWSISGLTAGEGIGGTMNDESWITETRTIAPNKQDLENSLQVKVAKKLGLPVHLKEKQKEDGSTYWSCYIEFRSRFSFHTPIPKPGQYENPFATKFYSELAKASQKRHR